MRSHLDRVSDAMRSDVWRDTHAVRREVIPGYDKCPRCGCVLTRDFHVDHAGPKFWELRDQFLTSQNVTPAAVRTGLREHQAWTFRTLESPELRAAWQAYHRANARLRPLCAPCNLKDA